MGGVNQMPYVSFVCPECGSPVDRSETFCGKCGVNLSGYDRLEKKTFYYLSEICPSCGMGGGYSVKHYTVIAEKHFNNTHNGIDWREATCNLCGYYKKEGKEYFGRVNADCETQPSDGAAH